MKDLRLVDFLIGYSEWSLALSYLVFAWSLTLKNFGLGVEDQLIAQRILTPLLFVAFSVATVLIKPVGLRLDLSSFDKMVVNSTTATAQQRMLLELCWKQNYK